MATILFLYLVFALPSVKSDDVQLYNEVGTVTGQVEISNHPELGRTPCRKCGFLLQRSGSRRCLLSVVTDDKGQYRVRIGLGRWRVIMAERLEGAHHSYDMLAPGQGRYIQVVGPSGEQRFDISVVLPETR